VSAVNGGSTDSGFVYGLGVEGKLTETTSARIEYLSFNSDSVHGDGVGVIRAGLSIKLGPSWSPQVSRALEPSVKRLPLRSVEPLTAGAVALLPSCRAPPAAGTIH
jgi:hypothetical protein